MSGRWMDSHQFSLGRLGTGRTYVRNDGLTTDKRIKIEEHQAKNKKDSIERLLDEIETSLQDS